MEFISYPGPCESVFVRVPTGKPVDYNFDNDCDCKDRI
jgi:hypothetical protein